MTKKQVSNLIDEFETETQSLLHTLLNEFKAITGFIWDFDTFINLLEDEGKKQLKIGNTQAYTELNLFLDMITVKN